MYFNSWNNYESDGETRRMHQLRKNDGMSVHERINRRRNNSGINGKMRGKNWLMHMYRVLIIMILLELDGIDRVLWYGSKWIEFRWLKIYKEKYHRRIISGSWLYVQKCLNTNKLYNFSELLQWWWWGKVIPPNVRVVPCLEGEDGCMIAI